MYSRTIVPSFEQDKRTGLTVFITFAVVIFVLFVCGVTVGLVWQHKRRQQQREEEAREFALYSAPWTTTVAVQPGRLQYGSVPAAGAGKVVLDAACPAPAQATPGYRALGGGAQTASAPMSVGAEPDPEVFPTAPPTCEESDEESDEDENFFV